MIVVRSRHVVLSDGERPAALHIERGTIVRVADHADLPAGASVHDVGDLTVSPGIVDSHVHVNEPGRTEWEGFDSATRAAAAGGITTLVDMPLNSVPATVDVAALAAKRAAASRVHVDVAFWGGVVPGNEGQLEALAAGVRGFKCFLTPSGVPEFDSVTERDLRRALPVLARLNGTRPPLLVHAEDPAFLVAPTGDVRVYATYLATRPVEAEVRAVRLIAALGAEYDVATHIVHLSSAEGVEAVAVARAAGVRMTAETCPHYLTFTSDDVPTGATAFKCAPPIREARHRDALWNGLRDGVLQLVATDHSPAPPAMKELTRGDFVVAWGGIASLQISLPVVWTEAKRRGYSPSDLARWMSAAPSALCGLGRHKGAIAAGHDADLVVWNPDETFVVRGANLLHRHALTPYEGRRLSGVVRETFVHGECVWRDGEIGREGGGHLL